MKKDLQEFLAKGPYLTVDGNGLIVGRAAARIAKSLLLGERVVLKNASGMLLTGSKSDIISKFKARRGVKNLAFPEHSPFWPRRPDLLVKRMIRNMLPQESMRGQDAIKRLRVYADDVELNGAPLEIKKPQYLKKFMTMQELCRELGWSG